MRRLAIASIICAVSTGAHAAELTVTLTVENMTCAICPVVVKTAIGKVPGVKFVTVDFLTKLAVVTFDDTMAGIDRIAAASSNAGYPAQVKE